MIPIEIKKILLCALENLRGDDMIRTSRAFAGLTPKQMQEEHGDSGLTRNQVLQRAKEANQKVQDVIDWVKKQSDQVPSDSDSQVLLGGLRELCGYVENGTYETVRIGQDEATREWILTIGKNGWYHAPTFAQVIETAVKEMSRG